MQSQTPQHVLGYLKAQQAAMADLLEAMVRAESPSSVPEAQRDVQALVREALETTGYHVRHLPGRETGGHLYARPQARQANRPFQLLLGHCDTVWPLGTLADAMPLERDGVVLRGPGVFDMKGGLVQMLYALKALQALDLQPSVTPVVFVNSDEEIGSPESSRTIRRLARQADRAWVMEPALEREGLLKTRRRGSGRFTLRVTGRSAHAGLDPEGGASAILELAHAVQKLHALNDAARGISVNVGQVEGGLRPNVVAAEARAAVDVRVRTSDDAERIERAIYALEAATPGTALHIEGRVSRPPMEATPRNRKLWTLAQEAGRRLGLELGEGLSGGVSDGNTTSQHTATLDGLGAVGDGAHAEHEFLFLDRMPERAALLALLLLAQPVGASRTRAASATPALPAEDAT